MFRRLTAFVVLIWGLGFLWFAVALPGPLPAETKTDAVIVLTGSAGRIERALQILEGGKAPKLLVSGVDREVRPVEFAAQFKVPTRLMACCITLGFQAFDTRSNAVEAGQWVKERKAKSVRLVTADWHMRRSALELARELPADVSLLQDGVPSKPSFGTLFLEYHKLLARAGLNLWESF